MLAMVEGWLVRLRGVRAANVGVAVLRLLIGFAFVPAGLKKVLGQPFTDPGNTGPFHDFLHAFHATGWFYRFVGVAQLAIAALLMTQRFAGLGAVLAAPVLVAITALCWSTGVVPTATVATLMLAGTAALVAWDAVAWRRPAGQAAPPIDDRIWGACGAAILALYGVACALGGGVYRPRGVALDEPGFYILPVIAALPVLAWRIEARRR